MSAMPRDTFGNEDLSTLDVGKFVVHHDIIGCCVPLYVVNHRRDTFGNGKLRTLDVRTIALRHNRIHHFLPLHP